MTPLVQAAHLGPSLVVAVLTAVLALRAGAGGRAAWVFAALLAGQLSIGWGNDLLDRERDRAAGRTDKPLVTGALEPRAVQVATAVALVAAVLLSLPAGWRFVAVHLAGVALGWAYNLGLKRTPLSIVAYAAAFGLVPVMAAFAAGAPRPPWWLIAAAACLGSAGHGAQTLGDEAADAATGVRGLPQRLGRRRTVLLTGALLFAGALLITVGLGLAARVTPAAVVTWIALAGALGVTLVGWRIDDRWAFRVTVATAALLVSGLVLAA